MASNSSSHPSAVSTKSVAAVAVPRIVIEFCTQCRWMLRAAYYAQELLTTFGLAIGEVALVPKTGGVFRVLVVLGESGLAGRRVAGEELQEQEGDKEILLWDRKAEGGFPETKVLKQRLRDHIEPEKNLGHSDKKPDTAVDNATAG